MRIHLAANATLAHSRRLGDECQPFEYDPPMEALFDPEKVAIVSNGRSVKYVGQRCFDNTDGFVLRACVRRCGSSCSLFSVSSGIIFAVAYSHRNISQISMAKMEGAKTVVVGGKTGVPQQYCGVVGGQSTHFMEIDSEIKVRILIRYASYADAPSCSLWV